MIRNWNESDEDMRLAIYSIGGYIKPSQRPSFANLLYRKISAHYETVSSKTLAAKRQPTQRTRKTQAEHDGIE